MVRIATPPKPPKRLFRSRRGALDRAIGPIPPGVERLRRAIYTLDPAATYRAVVNGQVLAYKGSELIETAKGVIAIADAHQAGDEQRLRLAALGFLAGQ
jgi:hypothetical protein